MKSFVPVALAIVGSLLAPAASRAGDGREDVVWLCKPGAQPNPCRESLETTVTSPEGETRVVTPTLARRPKFDCFYVYPTVSEQPRVNADRTIEPQQTAIARHQAARFSRHCRVYAPVYRQLTVFGLNAPEDRQVEGARIAYADVHAAFREYMRTFNRGRGFALIGHSQGTYMLRRLLRERIDPFGAARRKLVSAILPGGNFTVAEGRRRGGDVERIPTCRKRRQSGCVIAYSTYDEPPPANSRYARPTERSKIYELPSGPGYAAACTNPAALADGGAAPLHTLLRSEPPPGVIGLLLVQMFGGPPPSAETPWLVPRDRYAGECRSEGGANYLRITPLGDSRDLNPAPDRTWGLHVADVNLALGDLVGLLRAQARAFHASSP